MYVSMCCVCEKENEKQCSKKQCIAKNVSEG